MAIKDDYWQLAVGQHASEACAEAIEHAIDEVCSARRLARDQVQVTSPPDGRGQLTHGDVVLLEWNGPHLDFDDDGVRIDFRIREVG